MIKLDNNNHSVFALYYHLILTTKYRREVIDETIAKELENHFIRIAKNYHIKLQEFNFEADHVHILFKAHPNSELSKFLNAYKSASSRLVKKEHPEIKDKLWKEMFWSKTFCLLTTGGVTIDIIKEYIEKQGEA
ncbi:putative transposase [Breznakia sp. PH1-1]|nr:putative transposase [Breznakia sp. PH1-1]MDH6403977.1 putative transposase [Breznakia sp. PF1-11]MDH6411686.1 putative transposase [Breznakia sp. PFB1-11]MDH6414756.1 putative transposase [Breznakia sp. PFB1-14]MDH6416037.1 putative transposase [Breznakia sp. PFB1-4]MDH6418718.1 putative transposase [Breznakia sp. PFB1-12]MDH6473528.1 putative transposase [Breznakia sp. PFB2-30]MDH6475964.1 putative transposase [Breznakia sp. PFB1-19]